MWTDIYTFYWDVIWHTFQFTALKVSNFNFTLPSFDNI